MSDQDVDKTEATAENEQQAQESVSDAAEAAAAMARELGDISWAAGDLDFVETVKLTEEVAATEVTADQATTAATGEPETEAEAEASANDLESKEFVEEDRLLSILESFLFASDRPVSLSILKQLFKGTNIRGKDITRALDQLASAYADSRRGVSLEEIGGGYQLRTKVDNADFLRRLTKVRPFRLSGPALEVLSILAYKQPITKHEVDEIRGVESGHLVRALMERGLVNFQGKSDLPGKPMLYGTTRKFLEIFGLRNLKELPTLGEIDELIPEGIGETEEKETLSDLTGSLSQAVASTYSEGEEELTTINEQLQQIDTSTEFFEQEKVRQREKRDQERAVDIREALAVGEKVEDKDLKWLERFEKKMAQPLESVAAEGTPADAAANAADQAETSGLQQTLQRLQEQNLDSTEMTEEGDGEDELLLDSETIETDDSESSDRD